MAENELTRFTLALQSFLMKNSLATLRIYGRKLGLKTPCKDTKAKLIKDIVGVWSGNIFPCRTNRGAPVKNDELPRHFLEEIERLKQCYLINGKESDEEKEVFMEENPLLCRVDSEGWIKISKKNLKLLGLKDNDAIEQKGYKSEKGDVIVVLKKAIK